MKVFV